MKLTLEITKKGLRIRKEILNASGFHRETALDVRGMEQAVVAMKKEMTAMELVNAIHSLKDLASDLLVHLAKICGPCELVVASSASLVSGRCPKTHSLHSSSSSRQTRSAGLCLDACVDGCPYEDDETRIHLPDDVLEQAGLPRKARLDMRIGDREVILSEAESFDLRDVSPEMKELFRQTNICLGELDGLLAGGSVIYGG